MAQTPVRETPEVLIQCNTTLGEDETWTTLNFCRLISDSTGAGQIVGQAIFEQAFGLVTITDQADPVYSMGIAPGAGNSGPDDSLVGQLIRLLKEDDDGDITIGDDTYTAYWWGQAIGYTISPDNRPTQDAGGIARWKCAGLASILDQITIIGGWLMLADGSDWLDPGYCPPFNGVATGDMSLDASFTVNGQSVNVHDLSTLTPVGTWQGTQAVSLLLAGAAQASYLQDLDAYNGFPWSLFDPQNLLAYDLEKTDINGRTLAEALNIIINPRRGITYTVTVVDGTAMINVWSGTNTDITVGAFTLPASTNTATYVASGNAWTSSLIIDEDQLNTYDIIEIRGARPWTSITVAYDGTDTAGLIKGWDPAQEEGSGSYPPDGNPDGWNYFPSTQINDKVWRLFQINPQWDGAQYNDSDNGMRNILGVGNPGGGYDGTRSVDVSDSLNPPGTVYAMERATSASPGFGVSRTGPRQSPLVMIGNGTNGNWLDCSTAIDFATGFTISDVDTSVKGDRWGIDCQGGLNVPGFVEIDDGNLGQSLGGSASTNGFLELPGVIMLVTLGMREPQPLKVSYIFDQGTWPRSTPRIKMIDVPDLEQWVILPGTITGVDPSGNITTQSDLTYIRDDTAKANQLLALAVARYGYPVVNARFTERFLLDTDNLTVGTLLSSITLGTGDVYVGSVITRVTHNRVTIGGVDTWETAYETMRVVPDVEIVL